MQQYAVFHCVYTQTTLCHCHLIRRISVAFPISITKTTLTTYTVNVKWGLHLCKHGAVGEWYIIKPVHVWCTFSITLPLNQVLVLILKLQAKTFASRPVSRPWHWFSTARLRPLWTGHECQRNLRPWSWYHKTEYQTVPSAPHKYPRGVHKCHHVVD